MTSAVSPMRILWAVIFSSLLFCSSAHKAEAQVCSATVTDIDFGTANLLSSSTTDTLATVTITCLSIPLLEVVKICPSIEDGTGGWNGLSRLMIGPNNATLKYQLYQDAAHTQPWGSLTNPTLGTVPEIVLGSITGVATATRTIYARLLGGQATAPPGHYVSAYAGTEVPFSYSGYLFAAPSGCTGFVGTHFMYPDFDVVATPGAGCNLTTADLAFPNAGVLSNSVSGQTTLAVTCTNQTPYSISLDNGQTGTSPTVRKMKSATSDTVTYGLYKDSVHTQPWGAVSSSMGVSSVGGGIEQDFHIYGLVPAQATPRPGSYSDRIVVTLSY